MRILVTGLCGNYGGVESFFYGYFNEIIKIDKDITFDVLGYKDVVDADRVIAAGGNVFTVSSFSKNEIKNFMEKHAPDYDVLWGLAVDLSTINIIKYAKIYGIKKIILHSHCSSMMGTGANKIKKTFFHYIHRREIKKYVTDYWACSDFAAKWMFPKNVVKNKVVYIPNAIDGNKYKFNEELRNKKRREIGCNETLAIGFIGRLSPEKNPIFSIKVCEEINKQKDCILYIIGKGSLENQLKEAIKNHDLETRVKLLGLRNDVNELMQALDYVIIPSYFEGMPMVAIEAQTSGLPLVAASEGITKQICVLGTTKMIRLADGAKTWAETIVNVKAEEREKAYAIMSANGFNLPEAAIKLCKLLKQMSL